MPGWKIDRTKPTAQYSLFGADDEILYIGIGFVPETRWRVHAKRPWWSQVRHKEVTWYADRPSARAAELRLIRAIQPPYNIAETSRMDVIWANAPGARAASVPAQRTAPEGPRDVPGTGGGTSIRNRIVEAVARRLAADRAIDQLIVQARSQFPPVSYAELEEITGYSRQWLRCIVNGTTA